MSHRLVMERSMESPGWHSFLKLLLWWLPNDIVANEDVLDVTARRKMQLMNGKVEIYRYTLNRSRGSGDHDYAIVSKWR